MVSLAKAIGRALAEHSGLTYFHVPDGLNIRHAVRIVEEANRCRPTPGAPFAILIDAVGAAVGISSHTVPVVSPKDSVRYRQDDRTAVIYGRQPDLASFLQTFQEVGGLSYPDGASDRLTIRAIAEHLAHDLASLFQASGGQGAVQDAIADQLTMLRDLYEADEHGIGNWNVGWFEHVAHGLTTVTDHIVDSAKAGSAETLASSVAAWAPACFGLPGGSSKHNGTGTGSRISKLVEAFHESWMDADAVKRSLVQIAGRTGDMALGSLSVEGFDGVVADVGDPKTALAKWIASEPVRIKAFARVTYTDFVDPSGTGTGHRFMMHLAHGGSLSLVEGAENMPFVIPLGIDETMGGRQPRSDLIDVCVPWTGPLEAIPARSLCGITISPAAAGTWTTEAVSIDETGLRLTGRFHRQGGTGRNAAAFRAATLGLELDRTDPDAVHVPGRPTHKAFFLNPAEALLILAPLKANNSLGRVKVLDPIEQSEGTSEELVASEHGYQAMFWHRDRDIEVTLDGQRLASHTAIPELRLARYAADGENTFVGGDHVFRTYPVAKSSGQQSALIAAALKERVTTDRPGPATERSIRGQIEQWYSTQIVAQDADFHMALGHIAMPSDQESSFSDVSPQWGGAVFMEEKAARVVGTSLMEFPFDDEFIRCPEVENFRTSFRNLGLERLLVRQDSQNGPFAEWPSRTTLRSLWDERALGTYLSAYSEMVDAARRQDNDSMLFWAAYPLSLSVWDLHHGDRCSAVLLSPLHPIRLAWISGSESVLAEAQRARELLGTLEGWNFPVVGPGPRRARRMIAVPVDSGNDQIFLGWSMMVSTGTDEARSVESPSHIGSLPAPGTAATGLNQTSVDAALRSYRRMHPHATTLTVDLTAAKRQNRVTEIDSAVLRIAEEWARSDALGLAGGIRVLDSINRHGAPPHDEVTQLVRDNRDLLVTWSRYKPDRLKQASCDIRFLEGAGINVRVTSGDQALGAIADVPLRRFEAHGQLEGGFNSPSYPAVPQTAAGSPMLSALRAVEGGAPTVYASMAPTMLGDDTANWTVMGETHLNPAVMATLMQQYGGAESMLWEWRPPLFERAKGVPLVERRPHISVARVPASFGIELEQLLAKATDRTSIGDLKEIVIRTLGQRGVGLSSLLSLGGTHVAGALGFYLAFSLFDHATSKDSLRLVVPIDAADYFLRVLAGTNEHGQHYRRADLLLIDIADEVLTLSPVEIKSYGLKSTSAGNEVLPHPGATELDEPLDQLEASSRVMEKIAEQAASLDEPADRAVWFNALAALVETAIKLKPASRADSEGLTARLAAVANGSVTVVAGAPLLTYFGYRARTVNGADHFAGTVGSDGFAVYGLIADTGSTFEALSGRNDDLIRSWADVVNRAIGAPSSREAEISSDEGYDAPGAESSPPLIELEEEPQEEHEGAEITRGADVEEAETKSEALPVTEADDKQSKGNLQGITGDGVRIRVGEVLESIGHAQVDFWPSNTQLNQMNLGVVGDLGTGKTEFIKSLLAEIRLQAGAVQPDEATSILIFDYKGDFQSDEFIDRVGGLVLSPYRIPLNIFMRATDEFSRRPHQQAGAFVDTLAKIYSGIGPVQSSSLKKVIRDLYEERDGEAPTLAEVHELYQERQDRADSVSSILETFVYNEIFDFKRERLQSFEDLLNGRVLVVALDQLGSDQDAKNAVVALFLNLYYDYMIRSPKPPFQGSDPQLRYLKSFLVVDEAVNIMRYDFSVLMDLMLQGRQFGFGVVLSSQFLTHFDMGRTDYREPLRTWVIHRVPGVTPRALAALGMTDVPERVLNRISVLEKHQALYRSYGCEAGRLVRVTPYYELYGL